MAPSPLISPIRCSMGKPGTFVTSRGEELIMVPLTHQDTLEYLTHEMENWFFEHGIDIAAEVRAEVRVDGG